jgi:hypothetical protein
LYTGSWDSSVKAFSCKNGNLDLNSEAILIESSNQITKIKVSNDGNYLASGDSEGSYFDLINGRKHPNHGPEK